MAASVPLVLSSSSMAGAQEDPPPTLRAPQPQGSNYSPSTAGWLADRSRSQGPGFRVGNLELHPGVGVELGYDTNVFFEDENPEDSFLLRVTAHLNVSTLTQQRREDGETDDGDGESRNLDFRAGIAASYYHFFIEQARDNVALDANLALTINPTGRFSVYLHDEFSRAVRPFVDRATVDGSIMGEVPTYARDRNVAGVEARLQSAGGVLRGSLGYDYTLDYFEDDLFDFANSHSHDFRLNLSWRFLPQTALISRSTVTFQDYFRADDGASTALTDNWRVRSMLGINGALTEKLGFTVLAGYGAGFFSIGDSYDSVVAHADLRWRPRQTMQFQIGYDRRFVSSFIGNYMKQDRIYLSHRLLLGGSFLLGAEVGLSFDETGLALAADEMSILGNAPVREDIRLSATLYTEYRFTDWLGLNLSLAYYGDFTDYEYNDALLSPGTVWPDPGGGYQKFEAWLGLRVFY
ncbi:MAG: hypothetical protein JJ863_19650 [Deltaproteobacteria bacterium]|nr:hypothetical protein [Deltaproteobacteria bacterium]